MSEPTVPKIDDGYWFEWSKTHLDGALERRDSFFGTLQKLVVWLWGIYTTFAAVGFALSERALDLGTAVAISAASVLLIAVYWACVWGQMPVPFEFDPRSPDEIRGAHSDIILEKDKRLKIAMTLSLVAAASVALALVAAGSARTVDAPSLDVIAGSIEGPDSLVSVAVTARLRAETPAIFHVVGDPGTEGERPEAARTFLSTEDGLVQASLRIAAAGTFSVRVTWEDEGVEHSMTRVATRPAADSP